MDVELAGVVPAAVLEAFSEELGGRAAKRAARAAAEAAAAKREAAAERATAAAAKGPSAAELKVGRPPKCAPTASWSARRHLTASYPRHPTLLAVNLQLHCCCAADLLTVPRPTASTDKRLHSWHLNAVVACCKPTYDWCPSHAAGHAPSRGVCCTTSCRW